MQEKTGMKQNEFKIIGITGGIGSGKSTVLQMLKSMCSCEILMADDIAKKLMKKGGVLTETAIRLFGEDAYLEDGTINGKYVADIIYSDVIKKKKWENAVHPAVRKYIISETERIRMTGVNFIFLEAALLIENNYEEICDELWLVYAESSIRRQRLKETRMYSDQKISDIFKAQMSDDGYRKHCRFVIDTGKSFEDTRRQIENKLEEYGVV